MADAGLGVAILPGIARSVRGYDGLVIRPVVPPTTRRIIQAASRRDRALPPAASSFTSAIRDELDV